MTDKPKRKKPSGKRDIITGPKGDAIKAVQALLKPRSAQPRLVRFTGDPWEMQPSEPPNAYAGFARYRDMGLGKRSVTALCKELGVSSPISWSADWLWVQRAAAWDRELDRAKRMAELEAVQEMTKRHIQESLLIQGIGVTDLQKLKRRVDSKPDEMVLDPKEAIDFVERGAKMERLNRGEPESITEQKHELTVGDRRAKLRSMLDTNEAHETIERMADFFLADDTVVDADEPLEEVHDGEQND